MVALLDLTQTYQSRAWLGIRGITGAEDVLDVRDGRALGEQTLRIPKISVLYNLC